MSGGFTNDELDDDQTVYRAVVNDEDQWSIWPADRPPPDGWHDGGVTGSKAECLQHIERTWTDMRPRSLREAMGEP
jgi:MbtH protein